MKSIKDIIEKKWLRDINMFVALIKIYNFYLQFFQKDISNATWGQIICASVHCSMLSVGSVFQITVYDTVTQYLLLMNKVESSL